MFIFVEIEAISLMKLLWMLLIWSLSALCDKKGWKNEWKSGWPGKSKWNSKSWNKDGWNRRAHEEDGGAIGEKMFGKEEKPPKEDNSPWIVRICRKGEPEKSSDSNKKKNSSGRHEEIPRPRLHTSFSDRMRRARQENPPQHTQSYSSPLVSYKEEEKMRHVAQDIKKTLMEKEVKDFRPRDGKQRHSRESSSIPGTSSQ